MPGPGFDAASADGGCSDASINWAAVTLVPGAPESVVCDVEALNALLKAGAAAPKTCR
jgi:hypothetical protein